MSVEPAKFATMADLCALVSERDRHVNAAVECLVAAHLARSMPALRFEPAAGVPGRVRQHGARHFNRTYWAPDVTGSLDVAVKMFGRLHLPLPDMIPSSPGKVAAVVLRAIYASARA